MTAVHDFLSLEPLLVEHLKATVPAVNGKVFAASDLEGVEERSQPKPAIHVIYNGYRIEQSQAAAKRALVQQSWSVVVVVRNVRATGERARSEGGALLRHVLEACLGWKPSPEHSALELGAPVYRTTYRNGAVYLPLLFTTNTKIEGTN